jgi:hypothetical protein
MQWSRISVVRGAIVCDRPALAFSPVTAWTRRNLGCGKLARSRCGWDANGHFDRWLYAARVTEPSGVP